MLESAQQRAHLSVELPVYVVHSFTRIILKKFSEVPSQLRVLDLAQWPYRRLLERPVSLINWPASIMCLPSHTYGLGTVNSSLE
jgi:hypothetical protein